jgi:hypothetical protein
LTVKNITTNVDVDLGATWQVAQNTKLEVALNNRISNPQLNLGVARKLGSFEVSAMVANVARASTINLGFTYQLSPQFKLGASARKSFSIKGEKPSLEVTASYEVNFQL